jgi:hypothetical protein
MIKIADLPREEVDTPEFARQFTAFSKAKANANANIFKQVWQSKLDELCLASIQEK